VEPDVSLTAVEQQTLDFLIAFVKGTRTVPTVRLIAAGCGVTSTAVTFRLKGLKRKGYVNWNPREARTLVVLRDAQGNTP